MKTPHANREPIAIVGIGLRLPGASTPGEYWQLLREGREAVGPIPPSRFDAASFHAKAEGEPGKLTSVRGGFLKDIDRFDPYAFGISPLEAERMDPQQRLLLETVWEALEDAGIPHSRLEETSTGVYVGLWTNDYEDRLFRDPLGVDFYMTTGSGRYTASGRISHLLGLRGPAITLDTACSSSLVAVHLACRAIWSGDNSTAIAAGANVILRPHISLAYSRSRMLSADGRCKFGDARADGYVRSEGAVAIFLKPLAQALADGDAVYATIIGSAVNNDGDRGGSLGTPSVAGQKDLLRKAYRDAAIPPGRVQYVEAHGTGTRAGDPVEIRALGEVLGEGRAAGSRCVVGSVKGNIGHVEGAAGLAGLVKVALGLHHHGLPGTMHFEKPNPDVAWEKLPIAISREFAPWSVPGGSRIAGVSSFGIAGTNAHIVLRDHQPTSLPEAQAVGKPVTDPPMHRLLVLTAPQEESRNQLVTAFVPFLRTLPEERFADACRTAALRRDLHTHRLAVVASSAAMAADTLEVHLKGEARPGLVFGRTADVCGKLAFVFPGQGSQWEGMARELLVRERAFRTAFEACDKEILAQAGWSPIREVSADADPARRERIDVVQPVLFAIQVALAALWRHWGVQPDAVVGHSMGEAAAAAVAGALPLRDAVRVICLRSSLMHRTSGQGAMLLLELSVDEAARRIAGIEGKVSIAVSNSGRSTVLSGDPEALRNVHARAESEEVFARWVKVDVASHSPQMDPLRPELVSGLSGIVPTAADVKIYSTVRTEEMRGEQLTAEYWGENLRSPVLFSRTIRRMASEGFDTFVELSPHPILLPPIQHDYQDLGREVTAIPSMRRNENDQLVMLESLGALVVQGRPVRLDRLAGGEGTFVRLPHTPWLREHLWCETASAGLPATGARGEGSVHPLLGERLDVPHEPLVALWSARVTAGHDPWAFGHAINRRPVFAASFSIEVMAAAARELFGDEGIALRNVGFERLCPLDGSTDGAHIQTLVRRTPNDELLCEVFVRREGRWNRCASGTLVDPGDVAATSAFKPSGGGGGEALTGDECYRLLEDAGVSIGAPLRTLRNVRRENHGASGSATSTGKLPGASWIVPPDLLDGVMHCAALPAPGDRKDEVQVPSRIRTIILTGTLGDSADVEVTPFRESTGAGEREVHVTARGGTGHIQLLGVESQKVSLAAFLQNPLLASMYRKEWVRRPLQEPVRSNGSQPPPRLLLVGTDHEILSALAGAVQELGGMADVHHLGTGNPSGRDGSLREAILTGGPDHVLFIEADGSAAVPVREGTGMSAAVFEACSRVLSGVRVLAAWESGHRPHLWAVTRGAQAVVEEEGIALDLRGAAVAALGRVAGAEHPEFWGGVIDTAPGESISASAGLLLAEIRTALPGGESAVRRGDRYVPRLSRVLPSVLGSTPYACRPDAGYLVTGGLGALGIEAAEWLAARGARWIVLAGRRGVPPEPLTRLIGRLASEGIRLLPVALDVADSKAVHALKTRLAADGWPALRGIVHAAGVARDALLTETSIEALQDVLRAKVDGTLVLGSLFPHLDFSLFFSSVGALIGHPGQGSYAAANACLDALAQRRSHRETRTVSVAWPVWKGRGFAATPGGKEIAEHLASLGIGPLGEAEGSAALDMVLDAGPSHVAVLPRVEPGKEHVVSSPAVDTLLEEFRDGSASGRERHQTSSTATPGSGIMELLKAGAPERRKEQLEAHLRGRAAEVLKISPSRLERAVPFGSYGLTSLLALELRRRLEADFSLVLSATLLFNYPTLDRLGEYLLSRLSFADMPVTEAASGTPAGKGAAAEPANLVHDARTISDDEALRALKSAPRRRPKP